MTVDVLFDKHADILFINTQVKNTALTYTLNTLQLYSIHQQQPLAHTHTLYNKPTHNTLL